MGKLPTAIGLKKWRGDCKQTPRQKILILQIFSVLLKIKK